MEGQGRRKVLRVLKQSFGDLSAGHVFFPSAWASIFHKREHTWASSPGVPSSQCALVSALNGVSVLMHFSSVNLTALLKCCFRQDEQPWLLYHLSLIGRKSGSMELLVCSARESACLWGCWYCGVLLCTINWKKMRPWLWVFAKQSSAKEVFSSSGPWLGEPCNFWICPVPG